MHLSNKIKESPPTPGLSFFISYNIFCEDVHKNPVALELSPFSILIAGDAISKKDSSPIEKGLSVALLDIMISIESNFTLLRIAKNEKQTKNAN